MQKELVEDEVKAETKTKVGFDNDGHIVVKKREYRRSWKNRAQMEGKPSKKWFTTKRRRK